jgi:serine/threonine-protein phosphatase 5
LGKLKLALKDFKAVVSIVPKDPDAIKKMRACEKAVKEEAFLKAIESETDDSSHSLSVDIDSIPVDSSYSGPQLPLDENRNAIITPTFVSETIAYFRDQKLLPKKFVLQVLKAGISHFESLPSLLRLDLPVGTVEDQQASGSKAGLVSGTFTVCGDTHGQFYDLCHIFDIGGYPSDHNRYLFNGDFVDRGSFSFEVVFTLLLLKLACPSSLHMLRGNHETKNMNKIYGFSGEIRHKYDEQVLNFFTKLFQCLPLAAVIQDKVFVVHGGLSTQEGGVTLKDIENIQRFREPPESGLMSDLLWSDPQPEKGRSPSKRGLGYSFGPDYTQSFLKNNSLQLVIRSHEVKDEGYCVDHDDKCITIFSAPNYCDQMGNKGAFIRFSDKDMKPVFTKFDAVPHPDIPPMRYAGNMFSL